VKAERDEITRRADRPALVARAEGLRRIFDDAQAMRLGEFVDRRARCG